MANSRPQGNGVTSIALSAIGLDELLDVYRERGVDLWWREKTFWCVFSRQKSPKCVEVGSTMEYSKFHSIPFHSRFSLWNWNGIFHMYVRMYYVNYKLYLSTYYHVRKIVITLFSEPEPPPVVSLFLRKELYYSYVEMCDWFPPIRFQFQWNIPDSTCRGTEKFHSTFSPWNGNGTDL